MTVEITTETKITDDRLEGVGICVRHRNFAHLTGTTVKVEDRQRVVIPDQLGPKEVHALAEMFTAAAALMDDPALPQ